MEIWMVHTRKPFWIIGTSTGKPLGVRLNGCCKFTSVSAKINTSGETELFPVFKQVQPEAKL